MALETPAEGRIAIVALTQNGVRLALQLAAQLPESRCHVPQRHAFALAMGAEGFSRLGSVLPTLWGQYRAFVFIMATGIVVRQIAPLLRHKTQDPAVVVVDERGHFVISLVSGHLGGANRLAERIARLTGGQPVITTASDVEGKPAIDLIAQEAGLAIEDTAMVSRIARAILEGEPVWAYDPECWLKRHYPDPLGITWLSEPHTGAVPGIWVSERREPKDLTCLTLRPQTLVVGLGCNRGTPATEIWDLLQTTFSEAGLSPLSIRNLATIDLKSDEPGILQAAARLDRPICFYSADALKAVPVPNPSDTVSKHIGVASVCEAAALLSAQNGRLILPKRKTANVTLAVARVESRS